MIESIIVGGATYAKWAGLVGLGGATAYAAGSYIKSGSRKQVQEIFAACGLCNRSKNGEPKPWVIVRVNKAPTHTTYVMKFPYGKALHHVTEKADEINTAFGADCSFAKDGIYLIMDVPTHPMPSYVSFSEKMMELTRGNWKVIIGVTHKDIILHDFDQRPHLLIAGYTRGGKSVLLSSIIATLFLSHDEDEMELIGVDMKPHALEFRRFMGAWTQLASTPKDFLKVLIEAEKDMLQRGEILANAGVTNVQQYEKSTGRKMKRRFIIVDEYGKSFGSDFEIHIKNKMMQICALGAGLGVHIILCTQRPDADVVDGKIRANLGTVACFQVANQTQSVVVLGHKGAETIPDIPGRCIYQTEKEVTVQVPIISNQKLSKLIPNLTPTKIVHDGDVTEDEENELGASDGDTDLSRPPRPLGLDDC